MDGPRSSTTSLPMTAAVVLARCPIGAWKHELIDGALYFLGWFNVRDITVAERAYLSRRVLVNSVSSGREVDSAVAWIGAQRRSALRPLARLGIPWRSFDGGRRREPEERALRLPWGAGCMMSTAARVGPFATVPHHGRGPDGFEADVRVVAVAGERREPFGQALGLALGLALARDEDASGCFQVGHAHVLVFRVVAVEQLTCTPP
ncbi:hypothetical protein ACFWN5_23250 [Streptomyces sp. NPDC058430]|uniref:hypothetical protein n=1 Tax=Streptomyces sp. NPDC058430 TaxID=3346495 RepID=UPI00365A03FB